jgi:sugar-specific transcriptional regulator TrmB/DNA-binding CsgD family transcriptional regulator
VERSTAGPPAGYLAELGLQTEQEDVFTVLLEAGGATVAEVSAALALPAETLAPILRVLSDLGLVSRTAEVEPTYLALPFEQAMDVLVRRRLELVERARQRATSYAGLLRPARDGGAGDYLELVRGPDAIRQRFMHAQTTAREEVVVFDKPPYVTTHELNEPELALLDRGVRCRVVYAAETLQLPGQLDRLELLAARGEQARVNAAVPLKLFIVDRTYAILPFTTEGDRGADEALIVTRPNALLMALYMLFESVWDRSQPDMSATATAELEQVDRRLLLLLSAGLKDTSIATHLHVSVRTVERHVADLMSRLGCDNRYQLGVAAQTRGWHDG